MTSRAARRKQTEELAKRERQLLVDHADGGLRLTPGAVSRINSRLASGQRSVVAGPTSEKERVAVMATMARARSGLPPDVALSLNMLLTLADQGNRFAALLFESEAKRLGVWTDEHLSLPT